MSMTLLLLLLLLYILELVPTIQAYNLHVCKDNAVPILHDQRVIFKNVPFASRENDGCVGGSGRKNFRLCRRNPDNIVSCSSTRLFALISTAAPTPAAVRSVNRVGPGTGMTVARVTTRVLRKLFTTGGTTYATAAETGIWTLETTAPKLVRAGDDVSLVSPTGIARSALSMITAVVIMSAVAFFMQKGIDARDLRRMKEELRRVQEYKENMYFDAMDKAMQKLEDDNTEDDVKRDLMRQLRDLDPTGDIQAFIKNKSTTEGRTPGSGGKVKRPDLSELIARNRKELGKPAVVEEAALTEAAERAKMGRDDIDIRRGSARTNSGTGKRRNDDSSSSSSSSSSVMNTERLDIQEVLRSLQSALKASSSNVDPEQFAYLERYLTNRVKALPEESMRQSAIAKIVARIGNNEYWENYCNRLQQSNR